VPDAGLRWQRCMHKRHGALANAAAAAALQASLWSLTEGKEVTAPIVGLHLLHGVIVDLGCQWHGLVPVTQEQWGDKAIASEFRLGREVTVTIHKVRQPEDSAAAKPLNASACLCLCLPVFVCHASDQGLPALTMGMRAFTGSTALPRKR
jgi:hypothetical protein